jgi:hypothetical protein
LKIVYLVLQVAIIVFFGAIAFTPWKHFAFGDAVMLLFPVFSFVAINSFRKSSDVDAPALADPLDQRRRALEIGSVISLAAGALLCVTGIQTIADPESPKNARLPRPFRMIYLNMGPIALWVVQLSSGIVLVIAGLKARIGNSNK